MAEKDLKQQIEDGMCGKMPAGLGGTVYICRADENGIDESSKIAIDLKEAANDYSQDIMFNTLDPIVRPIMEREGKENLHRILEQPMLLYVPEMTDKGVVYHKIAEGKGLMMLNEKMPIPENHFAAEEDSREWNVNVEVKISKRRWRKIRQMAMVKKPEGYPRTKWVQRLTRTFYRTMTRQYHNFINRQLANIINNEEE